MSEDPGIRHRIFASFNQFTRLLSRMRIVSDGEQVIASKRAYEPAESSDGYRVLIDRLWPRGVSKAKARLDAWEKDIAPSAALRQWYGHDPSKWKEFKSRYLQELRAPAAQKVLDDLVRRARRGRVTLIYGSRAAEISDVEVIRQKLARRLSK